jgi:hypothetical protein
VMPTKNFPSRVNFRRLGGRIQSRHRESQLRRIGTNDAEVGMLDS